MIDVYIIPAGMVVTHVYLESKACQVEGVVSMSVLLKIKCVIDIHKITGLFLN